MDKHPLFALAENAPVAINEGRVFAQVDTMGEGCFPDTYLEKRRFLRKPLRSPLVEIGSLASLDELFVGRVYLEIREQAKEQARLMLENHPSVKEAIGKVNGDQGLAERIYHQVFPYLRQQQYDRRIQQLVGIALVDKDKESSPKLERLLEEDESKLIQLSKKIVKEIRRDNAQQQYVEEPRSAKEKFLDEFLGVDVRVPAEPTPLEKTFGEESILIVGKETYNLKDSAQGRFKISLAGKQYGLSGASGSLEDYFSTYQQHLGQEIKALALKEEINEGMVLEILRRNKVRFNNLGEMQQYNEGDFGFIVREGTYYVFLEVPTFAIHSKCDGKYYLFNQARIGIPVYANYGNLEYGDVVSINDNNHPFLHLYHEEFAPICVGYNHLPTSGKDMGEVIAQRLRKVSDILMFGYNGPAYASCYQLREHCHGCGGSHYADHIASKKSLEEKGIPIIEDGVRG